MAKNKKVSSPQALENVEHTLTRTEQYLEENYKSLLTVLAVIVGIVGIVWLGKIYINKRSGDAQSQMFQAERYFEADSMALALNGDGNYLGFIDIASSYKMTKAANLARYYSGIAYLKLGEYDNAIEYLSKFRKKDDILASAATAAMGDAWIELGDFDKGIKLYEEAIELAGENAFLAPVFLMKAGQVYESREEYDKALAAYQRILDEFPTTSEGGNAEKHIARVQMLKK
ncbi:MAG: tetratricopeptide repeat protein [Bacteroidales bacterium]|nr:tetratricopeptide repeat protein [Bacteroidales bacterium]